MERLSTFTLKNLWQKTNAFHFENNSERIKKLEYSLDCLCDVVDETKDEVEKGELLFGGLEALLEQGNKPSDISKSHRFMKLLTSFGSLLMAGKRGTEGFYLGIFCELKLSKSWHDLSFLKTLKKLFREVSLGNLKFPVNIKEKLLVKFRAQDEDLFLHYFPRAMGFTG